MSGRAAARRQEGKQAMGRRGAAAIGLVLAAALAVPRTARADISTIALSESQEVELGRGATPQIEKELGRYEDPGLEAYLNEVGQRLVAVGDVRGYRYSFKVVDRPEVNAFALPGGHIYVTRGLLAMANSEAEVAGVLGHEIAHVTQRHIAKQLTRAIGYNILALGIVGLTAAHPGTRGQVAAAAATVQGLLATIMTGYTKDLEAEADEVGLRIAVRAGYDPQAVVAFMRAMRTHERLTGQGYHAFSDHPATNERIVKADTQAAILRAQGGPPPLVRSDEYKAQLDGLRYGPAKEERRRNKRVNARDETCALIIDDSPTIVFALKKILQSAGFITLEALDAETGISIAREQTPDLIFLDIILPGVNGFAALRTLRKDPATSHIPIIMISGNEQATELFFGSRTGADDFMKKPFSRFEVFARIERLLDANMVPRRISVLAAESESGTHG